MPGTGHTPTPTSRRACALALAALALAALAACQGGAEPFADAYQIESLSQAIGGPTANARVGDFLLRNDQMKVVIEQGALSFHPADVGGSIIDIDLNRPEREFRRGRGLDQLGQIAPIANLSMAQATNPPNVRITRSRQGAEVTTATRAGPIFRILIALTLLLNQEFTDDPPEFRMYNEYELRPGERLLRVTTTIGFDVPFCPVVDADGCNAECDDALYDDDCECPQAAARCAGGDVQVRSATPLPDRPTASILDLILGDLPRPLGSGTCAVDADCDQAAGQTCTDITSSVGGEFKVCRGPDEHDGGVFLGDLLIFGGNLTPFVRGIGYDTETDIRRLFDQGEDTLARPLDIDAVLATGDRVSYGYASPGGRVLVPIFRGPFSLGATHSATCPHSDPGCLSGVLLRFERWVSVGDGDAASAREPIARALGQPLGRIAGAVTASPAGEPVSGARVFALADPRALPCDAACEAACPLPAGTPAEWTLDQLLAANKCRTVEPQFPDGTAAVETFALTDPGTDPIRDGRYRMSVPPGSYVLVALAGHDRRSALAAVEVSEDRTTTASLALPEPGYLEFEIVSERGKPIAGKVTIGRSLAGAPCASDDACAAGELCQAGSCARPWDALIPLELGGRRPQDGILVTRYAGGGVGRVGLPAGEYELVFSRGPHYSVDRRRVTIEPRVTTQVRAFVRRQVDREGWTAADFHIHATNSMDSGVALRDRVVSFMSEDMDFMSSSDHDWLTRYQYLIDEMGVSDRLSSQVGAEITTQEYGHYVAFPLRYQAWEEDGDGARVRRTSNGAVQWRDKTPDGIMTAARELQDGDVPVIVDIPHPYDYFEFYRLDPVTLEPTDSLLSVINPFLDPAVFSGDFDVMELVNSTAYARIRRPTVSEIRSYSTALDETIAAFRSGAIDTAEYNRRAFEISMAAVRQRLHRTVDEQDAVLAGDGADVSCLCGSDGDCAAGLTCDLATMTCVQPPASGGPEPQPNALCKSFRGVIDDWFNMLNRGVVRPGVSGSDIHGGSAGHMRTFLRTGGTTPPYLNQSDVAEALSNARAIVSNGPMVKLTAAAGGQIGEVGDVMAMPAGQTVRLSVRVEKADWYDVDRIEVYRNGELIHWVSACGAPHAAGEPPDPAFPCQTVNSAGVVAWDQEITDAPGRDAWYVVVAYGIDGRPLSPVYGSNVLADLGTPEITQRIYDIIPILREFRSPRYPSLFPLFPFAFTNPIWIDVNGDGWTPLAPPPSWCRKPGGDRRPDFGCR